MPSENLADAVRRTRTWRRETRLSGFGFPDYRSYVRSTSWREKRTEYWADPETPKACGLCETRKPPLVLHHRTYDRVCEERLGDLIPACPKCHALIHALDSRGDISGLDADLDALRDGERAAQYAESHPRPAPISGIDRIRRGHIEEKLANAHRRLEGTMKPRTRRAVSRHIVSFESQYLRLLPD